MPTFWLTISSMPWSVVFGMAIGMRPRSGAIAGPIASA